MVYIILNLGCMVDAHKRLNLGAEKACQSCSDRSCRLISWQTITNPGNESVVYCLSSQEIGYPQGTSSLSLSYSPTIQEWYKKEIVIPVKDCRL
jgi:hypothetical protein